MAKVPSQASDVVGWGVMALEENSSPSLPVEGVLLKTLLPNHGSYCPGHQVRVVLGTIAHKVAESKLPGLPKEKHSTGNMKSLYFQILCKRTQKHIRKSAKVLI